MTAIRSGEYRVRVLSAKPEVLGEKQSPAVRLEFEVITPEELRGYKFNSPVFLSKPKNPEHVPFYVQHLGPMGFDKANPRAFFQHVALRKPEVCLRVTHEQKTYGSGPTERVFDNHKIDAVWLPDSSPPDDAGNRRSPDANAAFAAFFGESKGDDEFPF